MAQKRHFRTEKYYVSPNADLISLIKGMLPKLRLWRPTCNTVGVLWHYETLDNLLKESA
jgi:hypothetical protein